MDGPMFLSLDFADPGPLEMQDHQDGGDPVSKATSRSTQHECTSAPRSTLCSSWKAVVWALR